MKAKLYYGNSRLYRVLTALDMRFKHRHSRLCLAAARRYYGQKVWNL